MDEVGCDLLTWHIDAARNVTISMPKMTCCCIVRKTVMYYYEDVDLYSVT